MTRAIRRARVAATALLATSLLASGPPLAAEDGLDPEKLVFLLQYVGADYGAAVREGEIVNTFEYDEMVRFSRHIAEGYAALAGDRPLSRITAGLDELQQAIRELRPWSEIRALTRELIPLLGDALRVRPFPAAIPDLARGAEIFATDCAPCHGARGAGDGFAAPGLDPPPGSFAGERMHLLSPHQIYNAIMQGIEGTGMPGWAGSRPPQEAWDVAFFVLTLRHDFAASPPAAGTPTVDLVDLARLSNEDLLARDGPAGLAPAHVDFYRGRPSAARPAVPRVAAAAAGDPAPAEVDTELDVQTALRFESAFARIAERTAASLVGLTVYARDATASGDDSPGAGWRRAQAEGARYPGFREIRRGSGFFVTDDGFLLTCHHLLLDPTTGEPAELIDVELWNQRHERARIVGTEPTVNLAVLKIEVPFATSPAVLGDGSSVRAGSWVIAMADPPGVDKSFVAGTVSARAERDCYQEQRTATLLQTSLFGTPLNHGGPLLDIRGRVIGVAMPRAAAPAAASPAASPEPLHGLPVDLALTLFEPLRLRESRRSPWLGISVLNLTWQVRQRLAEAPRTGIYIDDVFDPSPAAQAGVRVGDVLTRIDDQRMLSVHDFQRTLYLAGIGKEVTLELSRDGQTFERRVTVEQRPPHATAR